MNYHAIKHSHDELTEAIRRHNDQVADKITREFVREGDCPCERAGRVHDPDCLYYEPPTLEQVEARQRAQIQLALDALHKGNLDDVRRILETL